MFKKELLPFTKRAPLNIECFRWNKVKDGHFFLYRATGEGPEFKIQDLTYATPNTYCNENGESPVCPLFYDWAGTHGIALGAKLNIRLGDTHPDVVSGLRTAGHVVYHTDNLALTVRPDLSCLMIPEGLNFEEAWAIAHAPEGHFLTDALIPVSQSCAELQDELIESFKRTQIVKPPKKQ